MSEDLRRGVCVACRGDVPPIVGEELFRRMEDVPLWDLHLQADTVRLRRQFDCAGWAGAMALASQISKLAESQHHHPELTVGFGYVQCDWWTHKIGGLHLNDFICAAQTDEVAGSDGVADSS